MTSLKKMLALGVIALVLVLGVVGYNVLKAPAEASAPIQAIPLDTASSAAVPSSAGASPAPSAAATAAASAATTTPAGAATEAASPSDAATTAADTTSSPIIAQIVPEESEVRFIIDEVLNNAPKTVVGTTNQVAGELAVDPNDPTKTRVGTIQVNARTLATDSQFRDRAIKNQILSTDQYEFVTFTPKQIVGLPQNGAVGQRYTFQVIGDLTIRDVTKEVTFDVTATPASETRLEVNATTTIRYADYGITIPQVRQVASVADQVRLEIDFVATAT